MSRELDNSLELGRISASGRGYMLKIGTMSNQIRKELSKDRDNTDLQNVLLSIFDEVCLSDSEPNVVEIGYEEVTGETSTIRDFNYNLQQQKHLQKQRANRLRIVANELKKMGFTAKVYARTHSGNSYVPSWAEEPFLSVTV